MPRIFPPSQQEPRVPAEAPPWTSTLQGKNFAVLMWGRTERSTRHELCHITDATSFHGPYGNRGLSWRRGLHNRIISSVCHNSVCYDKATGFVQYLMNTRHEGKFDIGVLCSRGDHRSGACAWLIEQLLLCRGATVDVIHMEHNAGNWSHACASCSRGLSNASRRLRRFSRDMAANVYRGL